MQCNTVIHKHKAPRFQGALLAESGKEEKVKQVLTLRAIESKVK